MLEAMATAIVILSMLTGALGASSGLLWWRLSRARRTIRGSRSHVEAAQSYTSLVYELRSQQRDAMRLDHTLQHLYRVAAAAKEERSEEAIAVALGTITERRTYLERVETRLYEGDR